MAKQNFKKIQAYQEAIAVNAIVFLSIYLILHWLTSDEFSQKYESLVLIFATLRIVTDFGIILPEKEKYIHFHSLKAH